MSTAIRNNLKINSNSDKNTIGLSEISRELIAFIEQAPVAIALFDHNMRYLAVSRDWNTRYGRSGASLTGLSHYEVFPQTPGKWREVHKRVLAGEEAACDEDPVQRSDGGTDWVRWSMKPWRHPDGEIRGALAFREVITPQIEARREIATSEALFRETFENAPVGIAHVAPDGRWLLVNPRLCKMTGYSAGEFLTKTVKDLTHTEDFEAHLPEIKSMYRAEIDSFDMEKRYIHKDGSIVWVRLRVSCVRKDGGAINHFIAVIVDISQQKMAELALRESEERLRLAQEAAHAGSWEWMLGNNRNIWSDSLWALFGLTPGQCQQSFDAWASSIHPHDREEAVAAVREAAAAGREFDIQWRVNLPDGEPVRWLLSRGRPLAGAKAAPKRYIGIVMDITARKQALAELERMRISITVAFEMNSPNDVPG